ncbi:hypothetical protein [Corynebacterium ammoniagenes]|uniref:Secreted protein n=2 Tax=Corynebacterium ammoniagenes TaxID=1697 RepID=A0AAV5GCN0_CORAM|nr:hypothetical protein [Corynebacterium ammoniagenes]APT81691.1 hypothetical protein CAMM_01680 [Corynebacterium ammoniagenes DSM 20306]AQS72810.1 hypothetical protein CA40472_02020 [Corynebacterium ammoniagenes]EFG82220.1 hypothetical protein HMPREF0281_00598 [Corynebacterium ammoniagenes DSM 20306]GJN43830.1 hypothetical protein CAT723_23090 [Corynebacterium ammoniagenes]
MKKLVFNDRGSVTIEAALSLAVLMIVAAAIVGAIATMAAYISAVDIAGAAARAHAIGVEYQPPRSDIALNISESAGLITVTAKVPGVIGQMSADAVFPAEVGGQ